MISDIEIKYQLDGIQVTLSLPDISPIDDIGHENLPYHLAALFSHLIDASSVNAAMVINELAANYGYTTECD